MPTNDECHDGLIAKPRRIAFAFLGGLDDLLRYALNDRIISIRDAQGRKRFVERLSQRLDMLRGECRVLEEAMNRHVAFLTQLPRVTRSALIIRRRPCAPEVS